MDNSKLDDFNMARLEAYSQMVERGAKPAAVTTIQTRKIEAAKAFLDSQNVKYFIEDVEKDSTWKVIWIYKHDHTKEVIESLPESPKTVFDHWALGKLFGYSDEAIALYANKIGSVASTAGR